MYLELLKELSFKKSWGRNQVLNMGYNNEMLARLSSSFETSNVSRGEAMFCLVMNEGYSSDKILLNRMVKFFYEHNENLSKDYVISMCVTFGMDANFLEKFSSKLRALNSKRHLKDKLMMSYLELK